MSAVKGKKQSIMQERKDECRSEAQNGGELYRYESMSGGCSSAAGEGREAPVRRREAACVRVGGDGGGVRVPLWAKKKNSA